MSSRKNSARFTVDFEHKKIIGTRTSLNKAQHYGSPEYKELYVLMEAHPRFKVVAKATKENKSKQTYKSLSFTFIEKYISIQPNNAELMQEYKAVKASAEILKHSVYPRVKRLFIERFNTEDKPFSLEDATREIENAVAQAGVAV